MVTGPGGPLVSSAKKRRLAALEERGAAAAAAAAAAPPPPRAPAGTAAPRRGPRPTGAPEARPKGPANSTAASAAAAAALDPIYASLPEAAAAGGAAAARGLRPLGAPAPPGAGVGGLLRTLLATNPRASDARALTDGRLRDRALLLDNPTAAAGSVPRAAGPSQRVPPRSAAAARRDRTAARAAGQPAEDPTYEALRPLAARWQAYAQGLLSAAPSARDARAALAGAALLGAPLRVAEAPAGSRWAGLQGIVVGDGPTAFRLAVPGGGGRARVVPKAPCVFEAAVDARRSLELLGPGLVAAQAEARRRRK
jgi:hypothetical protein